MIRSTVVLICLLLLAPQLFPQTPAPPVIRNVQVRGNVRIPTETILHYISAALQKPFDMRQARSDLQRLYDLGMFQKLDIQTQEVGDGQIDVIYVVREQPFVSEFVLEGLGAGEEARIQSLLKQEKLQVQTEMPFRPGNVNKTANLIRSYMRSHKYPFSHVSVLAEEQREGTARVKIIVDAGPRLDIGDVRFSGNHSIPEGDLVKQLKYTRPAPWLTPWVPGTYASETMAEDLENLRRFYQSRGFAAVQIGTPKMVAQDFPKPYRVPLPWINGPKQKLVLLIPVIEGPIYKLVSVTSEGSTKLAEAETKRLVESIRAPGRYDNSLLTSIRQKIADALGHYGYALAQVELEQNINDTEHTVAVVYRIRPGNPVAIGRINFEGNIRLREKFLRRELVPHEGEIFDSAKLDQSIKRINKSGLIQEVQRKDVSLAMNEQTQSLDITFKVKEKDRQGIYGTGGTGGISGGYLGILYTAFDLFGLGEALSLQIDGGAAQSNMLLNIIGTRFLGLPFMLGLSVFHRVADFNIASIVPNASDLIQILRHRSNGVGLSGAYPITSKMQVGLGAQFEKLSLTEEAIAGAVPQKTKENRTQLSPSFSFDSTRGIGPEMRGSRFLFSTSWAGTGLLRSVDSMARSVRISEYVKDPLSKGRNSFAFRIQGATIRPRNGVPLNLNRRFYPGDEIVRGFSRGGLTTWASGLSTDNSPTPVGADTVLGFSMEYRIPIQGPFSAAAFVDLGWSGLSGKNVDADTASKLISEANRILRASVGGELSVQLPIIRQPGRFIFSWNPLRLGSLIQGKSGLLQLIDPRGTFHFALGDRY